MSLKDYFDKIKQQAQEGVKGNLDKMNDREKTILPLVALYQQEESLKQTKKLMWATWALAIVTIILALITYFKS